jgi:hypothetical protein
MVDQTRRVSDIIEYRVDQLDKRQELAEKGIEELHEIANESRVMSERIHSVLLEMRREHTATASTVKKLTLVVYSLLGGGAVMVFSLAPHIGLAAMKLFGMLIKL